MKARKKAVRKTSLSKAQLAAREKAIIADIAAGKLSYRKIAEKHGVSLPTVNNKARKAGISRGRRPGAKIVVAGPKRAPTVRPTKARRTAKAARKATRKAAPKRARKVGRPMKAAPAPIVADRPVVKAPVARAARRTAPQKARKAARRGARPRVMGARGGFADAMREVVLKYHPTISLRAYERLMKVVQRAIA